jgi:hypothetical protein
MRLAGSYPCHSTIPRGSQESIRSAILSCLRLPAVMTLLTALLVAPAPTAADCNWVFNWYCPGCSKIGGRTTGTMGGFETESACESARARWKRDNGSMGGGANAEPCYRPGGGCDVTPPKPEPPVPPRRDNPGPDRRPPERSPWQPKNVDPEEEKKAAEAERARLAAEKKRTEEVKVQRDKADILKNLKGASSADLGLKGVDSDTLKDNSNPLGLKKTEEPPKASGLSKVMPIYWRSVSVPAACVVADQIKAGDVCYVVDAYDLLKVLNGPNGAREFAKLLLEKAMKKALVIGLGAENLESKADLVKAMYEAEVKMVDEISRAIIAEMTQDPVKQAWLTQQAKLDSDGVTRLKQKVVSQKLANVQASLDYLQQKPDIQGIRFNCTAACRQLIQTAQGMGVLE